jgi:hypothetical protein
MAAAEVAVNVATLVLAVEAGLNDTVTPLGRPETLRATLPVKPLFGVTVIVLVPMAPCTTFNGEAESVNDAGVETVKAIATVAVRLPDLPVTVTVAVPAAAVAPAVNVRVLDVVALAGLNDAVTPLGSPATVRATAPVNPDVGETAIGAVAVPLWTTVTADADVVNV